MSMQTTESPAAALPQGQSIVISREAAASFKYGLEPNTLSDAMALSEVIARTRMCGITSADDALTRLLMGRELGLSAMQSIRGIYTVEGRPGLDASLMHALCMQSPECEEFHAISVSHDEVVYHVKRRGRPRQVVSFSMKDAEQAGLTNRGNDEKAKKLNNWNKYPVDMMHARCKARGARLEFADKLFGLYSREEILDGAAPLLETADGSQVLAAPSQVAPTPAATHAKFEAVANGFLDRIGKTTTAEAKKALRAEIQKAVDDGDLVTPYLAKVREAYAQRWPAKATVEAAAQPAASPAPPAVQATAPAAPPVPPSTGAAPAPVAPPPAEEFDRGSDPNSY